MIFTQKIALADIGNRTLFIGKEWEHKARQFNFDISPWVEACPKGTIEGVFKTPDCVSRETVINLNGNIAEWVITNAETFLPGRGELELIFKDPRGLVAKTATAQTVVKASISCQGGELMPPIDKAGPQGEPGVGIDEVVINEDSSLTIKLTDGTEYTTESLIGPAGPTGERGPEGPRGEKGETGNQGPEGPQGKQGEQGDPGPEGPQGDPGKTGDTGPEGPRGEKGDPGAGITNVTMNDDFTLTIEYGDGSSYVTKPIKGEKGDPGQTGATGPEGPQGLRGSGISNILISPDHTLTIQLEDGSSYQTKPLMGEIGPVGPEGPRGEKGEKGDTGPEGPVGPIGTVGPMGPAGPQGNQGDPGPGITNVTMNDDYTLTIEYGDGQSYKTRIIRGPVGPVGPAGTDGLPGPTGPQGPSGEPGIPGSMIYLGETITGTSVESQVFEDSGVVSAHVGDIYINTSTGNIYRCMLGGAPETATWGYQFCIIGPRGEQGATGERGPQGEQGDIGLPGPEGARGPEGEQGPPGENGEQGPQGVGIKSVELQDDYSLKITLTDESSYQVGPIRGETGPQGVGIEGVELQEDYTLKITLTNGGSYQTNPIRGEAGPAGDNGISIGTITVTTDNTSSESPSCEVTPGEIRDGKQSFTLAFTGLKGEQGAAGEGSGGTAEKLATPREIQINLADTTAASFDGSADIQPGVTGRLGIANGGTGAGNASDARMLLGVPEIKTSATDIVAGETQLASGRYYFVYE